MTSTVKRQKAVRGFIPATYAVFCGEYLLKIFPDKAQAERFARAYDDPEARKTLSHEELAELHKAAFSRHVHYAQQTRPWYPGIAFPDLEDASEKLSAICDEILSR